MCGPGVQTKEYGVKPRWSCNLAVGDGEHEERGGREEESLRGGRASVRGSSVRARSAFWLSPRLPPQITRMPFTEGFRMQFAADLPKFCADFDPVDKHGTRNLRNLSRIQTAAPFWI